MATVHLQPGGILLFYCNYCEDLSILKGLKFKDAA